MDKVSSKDIQRLRERYLEKKVKYSQSQETLKKSIDQIEKLLGEIDDETMGFYQAQYPDFKELFLLDTKRLSTDKDYLNAYRDNLKKLISDEYVRLNDEIGDIYSSM
jgi:hypothetical protein